MAINVGIVGCGHIGNHHLRCLSKIKEVKITALYDVDFQRAKNAQVTYGGEAFSDYDEMLKRASLDALYICLPPFAHRDYEMKAIKKGINLFVEKPVHISLQKAREIAKAIKNNRIISTAGYQDRYVDIISEIKNQLKGRSVGLIIGKWIGGLPGVAWWRHKKESGGQMVEMTTHIFDMCRYLFGEVKSVYAIGMKGIIKDYKDYDVEDASAVNLVFKSGLIGTISSACYLRAGWDAGIDIYCRDYVINYKERQSYKLTTASQVVEKRVVNDPCAELEESFIKAVKNRQQSWLKSSYEDAVKTLEVTLLANKSLSSGMVIKL